MPISDITPEKILKGGKKELFNMGKMLAPIIVGVYVLSGIFIVGPEELGVVRRFGKEVRVVQPGPHYHWPWPVETVNRPKVMQIKRMEIGFRTVFPGPPARYRF